jgi:Rieske Fe-S protein
MSFSDRRRTLVRLFTLGVSAVGAALAGLVAAVAAPREGRRNARWRRAVATYELPPDTPHVVVLAERQADGWYETRKERVIFIDREGDGYRALSATCTHLGCRVSWQREAQQFRCPCHGGVFDREGRVLAGPPPAPLQRVNLRVNPQTSEIEVEL